MSVPAALHGWHARPGTSSSLAHHRGAGPLAVLAAHRPAPVRSRVANSLIRGAEWLITRLHKFDSYERGQKRCAQLCLPTHCSKARMLPCDARGERSGTCGCPCALRARTAVCGPSHRAARCSRAPSAATANLSSHDSAAATPQHSTAATPRLTAATARRHQQQS